MLMHNERAKTLRKKIEYRAHLIEANADPFYIDWDLSTKSRQLTYNQHDERPDGWDYFKEATEAVLDSEGVWKSSGTSKFKNSIVTTAPPAVLPSNIQIPPLLATSTPPLPSSAGLSLSNASSHQPFTIDPSSANPAKPSQTADKIEQLCNKISRFDINNKFVSLNHICEKVPTESIRKLVAEHKRVAPIASDEFYDVDNMPTKIFFRFIYVDRHRLDLVALGDLFGQLETDDLMSVAFYICDKLPKKCLRHFLRRNPRVCPIAQEVHAVFWT